MEPQNKIQFYKIGTGRYMAPEILNGTEIKKIETEYKLEHTREYFEKKHYLIRNEDLDEDFDIKSEKSKGSNDSSWMDALF